MSHLDSFRVTNSKQDQFTTTNFGVRISDDDTGLKAGNRGPTLLEDFHLREKITHFDHERIPERVVHARGAAAHGYFQVYKSLEHITKAPFLCDPTRKTPVFLRFSTVLGSKGSADTVRDVRGFAVRFYTDEGNWDLVGNNIPVFFIQESMKFPDIIHAGKPEPHTEIPQAATAHDNFWDFMSLQSETAHMAMWILSDRTIPRSLRMMEGFGVHTFVLVDKNGTRRFVKFHWKPKLGVHSLVWDEAQKISGQDPDFHRRDLYEAIESGAYPEWELGVQVLEESREHEFDFDILDSTKLIPEELVPIQIVGKMVLNRNPTDVFAETEQVAFCTQNIVPGIDFSNDPLLQGRNHSYLDTQLTRLGGPNFVEIPINRPRCPVFNNQRDGFGRQKISTDKVNYYPNRFGYPAPATPAQGGFSSYPEKMQGIKERARGPKFQEHFQQATLFYNSLSPLEKNRLVETASFELGKCDDESVPAAQLKILVQIDADLAKKVAEKLGVAAPAPPPGWKNHGKTAKGLSMEDYPKGDISTRKIAVLVADGFDGEQFAAISAALKAKGAIPLLVAPRGYVKNAAGVSVKADFTILTCKSTLFDAVFIPGGHSASSFLPTQGNYIGFVNEAYRHFKAIGAVAEGVAFLKACTLPGIKLTNGTEVVDDQGVVTSGAVFEGYAKTAEGIVGSTITGAVTGAVGSAGVIASFINAVGQHRFWARDVTRVPV